ncbi:MAG: glutathione S-transferase family protein [Bdellovibrionales bacterium]|nr:glutathione S-transferase family protein [Bdellovibrionales bacterium]
MSHPNTYRLFLSQRSPFARRVRLALKRLDLPVEEQVIDVFGDHPEFLKLNPLGMVPALRTPEGMALYDSSAILETLDDLGAGIWPRDRMLRQHVRQASTLVTGMIQATVAFFQESSMHEAPSAFWIRDHFETIKRARERILGSPLELFVMDQALTQAGWDLAVAKDYLDLRMKELALPEDHALVELIMRLAILDPEFEKSKPRL